MVTTTHVNLILVVVLLITVVHQVLVALVPPHRITAENIIHVAHIFLLLTTPVLTIHVAQQKTLVLLPDIAVLITVLVAAVQTHAALRQGVVHQVNMQGFITLVAAVLTTVLHRLTVAPTFQPVARVVLASAYQVQVAAQHITPDIVLGQ
jgi:hypothetical protein